MRRASTHLLGAACATLALGLGAASAAAEGPGQAVAQGETAAQPPSAEAGAPTSSTAAPAPEAPAAEPVTPQVQSQVPQGASPSSPAPKSSKRTNGGAAEGHPTGTGGAEALVTQHPVSPSSLTPALPLALSASLTGLPSFFIESFRIP